MEDHLCGLAMPSSNSHSEEAKRDRCEAAARVDALLRRGIREGVSDVHLATGLPPYARSQGRLLPWNDEPAIGDEELATFVAAQLGQAGHERLENSGSVDGALTVDQTRFRYNLYRRSGQWNIAFRRLEDDFRSLKELGLPDDVGELGTFTDGLVLVAGPTGSGKSTTLATLLDSINGNRNGHIITIEDPVEYIHTPRQSLVTQRQIGTDAPDFHTALVAALRQDPDVILIGELRDLATIRTAITAAETGHLVLATVHAGDCVGAIERLISVFPADEQSLMRRLVSMVLRAVVAQHLLVAEPETVKPGSETTRPKRVLASEVLRGNAAVANLIASANVHQIVSVMETGAGEGMYTLDSSLARLWKSGAISEPTALALARNPATVAEMAKRNARQRGVSLPVTISRS